MRKFCQSFLSSYYPVTRNVKSLVLGPTANWELAGFDPMSFDAGYCLSQLLRDPESPSQHPWKHCPALPWGSCGQEWEGSFWQQKPFVLFSCGNVPVALDRPPSTFPRNPPFSQKPEALPRDAQRACSDMWVTVSKDYSCLLVGIQHSVRLWRADLVWVFDLLGRSLWIPMMDTLYASFFLVNKCSFKSLSSCGFPNDLLF